MGAKAPCPETSEGLLMIYDHHLSQRMEWRDQARFVTVLGIKPRVLCLLASALPLSHIPSSHDLHGHAVWAGLSFSCSFYVYVPEPSTSAFLGAKEHRRTPKWMQSFVAAHILEGRRS